MRHIILSILLIASTQSFSQKKMISFENTLKVTSTVLDEAVPVVNNKTGDVSLFLIDSKKIYGSLFNKDLKIISELSSERRKRKHENLIGYSISENNDYRVYLSNNKKDKFATINYSFKTGVTNYKEIELELKNEKFLETVVNENKFHFITITKKESIINIYSFDNEANFHKQIIDLSNEIFLNEKSINVPLYDLFYGKGGGKLMKIEEDTPNSIEITSEKNKLYLRDKEILLSFDENKTHTQFISINLNNFDFEVKSQEKTSIKSKGRKQSNSFVKDNYFYALTSTKDYFTFKIYNFQSSAIIKEFSAAVDETISFKNSPIIQDGGYYDSHREMEKTQKFLRKITSGDLGITVEKIRGNYQILLGGKKEVKASGGGPMMISGGSPTIATGAGGAISVTPSFNPTFYAYNSYTNTISTFIKCLFDEEFNHILGEFEDNVFDRIETFKDDDPKNKIYNETVFKYHKDFVFGYYDEGKYHLRLFTE